MRTILVKPIRILSYSFPKKAGILLVGQYEAQRFSYC